MNVRAKVAMAAVVGMVLCAAGCGYKPGGNMHSDDEFTYYSEPHEPKSFSLIDTSTGQTIWSYELPVGRQLTIKFDDDYAPDNALTPCRFHWGEFKIGTSWDKLENSMLVPGRTSRRFSWFIRSEPELPRASADAGEGK